MGSVKAQQTATLQPANHFSIAINETSYPYHFIDNTGEPAGLMVELWQLWAQKQGVTIVFKPMPWMDTLTQVQQGNVTIHAGMSKTMPRAEFLDFSQAFFNHKQHLFVHRSLTDIKQIDDLRPYTIGLVAGSSQLTKMAKTYPHFNIKTYPNRHALYSAALNKDILVFAGIEHISRNFEYHQKLSTEFPAFKRLVYSEMQYCAAVAKNSPETLAFIKQGFDKITADEKAVIERKWLGIEKSSDTLLLMFDQQMSPFSEYNRVGDAQGFLIEFWKLWSKTTGYNIAFVGEPHDIALEKIKRGHADFHIGVTDHVLTSEQQSLSQGPVIYEINVGLFLSHHISRQVSLSKLDNLTIGVIKNTVLIEQLKHQYPNANLYIADNIEALIHAAKSKAIDAMVGESERLLRKIVLENLQTKFMPDSRFKFVIPLHVAFNSNRQELQQIVVDGIKQMPLTTLASLEREWHLDKNVAYFKHKNEAVSLSAEEALWREKHPKIKVGLTRNWPPVEYVDKQGTFKGINPDVFDLLSQRSNIEFEYVPYPSFSVLYQALLDGEVDVIGSIMETPERSEKLLFTESYWSMPWVIVHPFELGRQLTIESFKGRTLAISKGQFLVSSIRKEYPSINLRLVDSSEEGFMAVQKGMVDGFIDSIASGSELMKKESLVHLTMSVIDEVDRNGNHLAINKSQPLLASILNKAVASITDTQSQQIYEKWFDITIETGLDKGVVTRVAVQIGILVLLILIIIMIWNRRLYREIDTRKRLERQMKYMATHDDLTGLANRVLLKDRLSSAINFHYRQSLSLAVLFIDLDGFKNINDTHGHDIGDELLIEVAQRLKECVRESDTVVRFGGDEFVILLTGLNSREEAAFVAEKVLNVIHQPMVLTKVTAEIYCSIGIAMFPNDGETSADLLKVADSLMYKVKARGKNHFIFNTEDSKTP